MEISNFKFKLKPVHPESILKISPNLRNSKAVGFDDIEAYVLKMVKRELTPAITYIVSLSIRCSVLTFYMEIFKSNSSSEAWSLRPIELYRLVALLPVVSKVLERTVFLQIVHSGIYGQKWTFSSKPPRFQILTQHHYRYGTDVRHLGRSDKGARWLVLQ
jgi:hypothetical protein